MLGRTGSGRFSSWVLWPLMLRAIQYHQVTLLQLNTYTDYGIFLFPFFYIQKQHCTFLSLVFSFFQPVAAGQFGVLSNSLSFLPRSQRSY